MARGSQRINAHVRASVLLPEIRRMKAEALAVIEPASWSAADYAQEPVAWNREVLGEQRTVEDVLAGKEKDANAPWAKQAEIMESVRDNRRTIVGSGHNIGKTHIAARVGLHFLYTRRPSVVLTTAPKITQVRDLLWARWRWAWSNSKMKLGGECLTMRCKPDSADPTWFAVGLTARDDASFQGYHEAHVLIILDEAPGISPKIWEAVEGMLSGENVRALAIGNPTERSGPFFNAYRSPLWHSIKVSSYDHPNVVHQRMIYPQAVSPSWPAERLKEWGEESPLYKSRVLGEFPDEGEDTLIPLAWVEAAVDRDASDEGPSSVGVDVARFGADETVFVEVRGAWVEIKHAYNGKDLMKTAGRVSSLRSSVDKVGIDDAGLGGGVTDRCTELGIDVIATNAGEKAERAEDFANSGSEMCWRLREVFRETYESVRSGKDDPTVGISIPNDPILIHQLTGRKYDYRSDGRIKVESKDDMRRRGERSPDRADALSIAWWVRTQKRVVAAMVSDDDPEIQQAHREAEERRLRGEDPDDEADWRNYDARGRRGILTR